MAGSSPPTPINLQHRGYMESPTLLPGLPNTPDYMMSDGFMDDFGINDQEIGAMRDLGRPPLFQEPLPIGFNAPTFQQDYHPQESFYPAAPSYFGRDDFNAGFNGSYRSSSSDTYMTQNSDNVDSIISEIFTSPSTNIDVSSMASPSFIVPTPYDGFGSPANASGSSPASASPAPAGFMGSPRWSMSSLGTTDHCPVKQIYLKEATLIKVSSRKGPKLFKNYILCRCGKEFFSATHQNVRTNFQRHRRQIRNPSIQCPECREYFTRQDNLRKHQEKQHKHRHQCPHCHMSFDKEDDLNLHVVQKHSRLMPRSI